METNKELHYQPPVFPMSEFRLRSYCHMIDGSTIDPFEVRLISRKDQLDKWQLQLYFIWPKDASKVKVIHNHDSFNNKGQVKDSGYGIDIDKSQYLMTNSIFLSDIQDEKYFHGSGELIFLNDKTEITRYYYHIDFFRRVPIKYRLITSIFDEVKNQNILTLTYSKLKKLFSNHKYKLVIDYPKINSNIDFEIVDSNKVNTATSTARKHTLLASKNRFSTKVRIRPKQNLLLKFSIPENEEFYYFENNTPVFRKRSYIKAKKEMVAEVCPYCFEKIKRKREKPTNEVIAYDIHSEVNYSDTVIKLDSEPSKNKEHNVKYFCRVNRKTDSTTDKYLRVVSNDYMKLPTVKIIFGGYKSSGKSVNLSRVYGYLNYMDNTINTDIMRRISNLLVQDNMPINYQQFLRIDKSKLNTDGDIKSLFKDQYTYSSRHELIDNTAQDSIYKIRPPFEVTFPNKLNIYGYDFAGENFINPDPEDKKSIDKLLKHSEGLFWHLDLDSLSSSQVGQAFQNYIDAIGSAKKINIAVLITKYDAIIDNSSINSTLNHFDIYDLMKKAKGKYQGSKLQQLIELSSIDAEKMLLNSDTGENIVDNLRQIKKRGGNVCYFVMSALGHNHINSEKIVAFETQSYRLELPIVWLLGQLGFI